MGPRGGPRRPGRALALGLAISHVPGGREPSFGGLEVARGHGLGIRRGDSIEGRGPELHTGGIDRRNRVS